MANNNVPKETSMDKVQAMKKSVEATISRRVKSVRQRRLRALRTQETNDIDQYFEMNKWWIEEGTLCRKGSLKDFKLIKMIGKGSFCELHIVQNINDNKLYTLKSIIKKDGIKRSKFHIYSLRDLMISRDYKFVVELRNQFQNDVYLYCIMDYFGGNLMNILMKQYILSEKQTQFYMAELTLAIDAVHDLDFVARDIKPENILIRNNGHIELTDFGLAKSYYTENDQIITKYHAIKDEKLIINEDIDMDRKHHRDRQLVGTSDYIAPEILGQRGYDKMVDWWSMGIIMFECLIGYTPFYQHDPLQTCQQIVHYRKYFKIPKHVKLSIESVDLIQNLICSHRRRYAFEQIKKHSFFKQIEWSSQYMLTRKPPFIPIISIDKIDILIIGYIRFKLSHNVSQDIIKLIVVICGSDVIYMDNHLTD